MCAVTYDKSYLKLKTHLMSSVFFLTIIFPKEITYKLNNGRFLFFRFAKNE